MATQHIQAAKAEKTSGNESIQPGGKPSLFRQILNSDMPESEKSVDRLSKEAMVLLGAGSTTTARTLDYICYYVLADSDIRAKLQDDLREIMEDYPRTVPSWSQLEKRLYLQAIIKEGLRCGYPFKPIGGDFRLMPKL